jgi:hypothetical protein
MQMPDVPNVAVDSNGKVKVTVWVYRKLTEDELCLHVIAFFSTQENQSGL